MSEDPTQFTAETPTERPWWKRPWGIAVLAIAGLLVLGGVLGEGPEGGSPDAVTQAEGDQPDTEPGQDEAGEPDADPEAAPEPSPEPETLVVPTVVGSELADAQDRLEPYDVTVEVVRVAAGLFDPAGVVVDQDPDREVEVGGTVTLTATEVAWSDPITLTGSGPDVADLVIPDDGPAVLELTHDGSRNFIVESIGAGNDSLDLLVNEIGAYSGTRLVNLGAGDIASLSIEASGPWEVVARPLRDAPRAQGRQATGTGDAVVLLPDGEDATRMTLTHAGSRNFIVEAYGGGGRSLLVNEIGPFEGTVRIDGAILVAITADGAWTLQHE